MESCLNKKSNYLIFLWHNQAKVSRVKILKESHKHQAQSKLRVLRDHKKSFRQKRLTIAINKLLVKTICLMIRIGGSYKDSKQIRIRSRNHNIVVYPRAIHKPILLQTKSISRIFRIMTQENPSLNMSANRKSIKS